MLKNSVLVLFAFLQLSVLVMPSQSLATTQLTCEKVLGEPKKGGGLDPHFEVKPDGSIRLKATRGDDRVSRMINYIAHNLLRKAIGLKAIEVVTARFLADKSDRPYFEKLAEAFGAEIEVDSSYLARIPKTGPVIIIANHPMNGFETLVLAAAVSKVRPDVKIVMTKLLATFPEMEHNAFLVNPFGNAAAKVENVSKVRDMDRALKNGECFIMHPSGEVSIKDQLSDEYAIDSFWKPGVARLLAANPETQILPVFIPGQASQSFQKMKAFGRIIEGKPKNKALRIIKDLTELPGTIAHIREISNRVDTKVEFTFGRALKGATLDQLGHEEIATATTPADKSKAEMSLMARLKTLTYLMKDINPLKSTTAIRPREVEYANPIATEVLLNELVGANSKARLMLDMAPDNPTKRMKVFLAKGRDIPNTLKELGRAREITFWEAGEGTGRERDNDKYDNDYYHFIAWDKAKNRIAGSYRMGKVGELIKEDGFLENIYTSEQFDHANMLTQSMGDGAKTIIADHTLEFGRSIVLKDYQKRSPVMLAIFSAIGMYITENPQYCFLMGPVSISNEYQNPSKRLIMAHMMGLHKSPLAGFVSEKHPFEFDSIVSQEAVEELATRVKTPQDLDKLVQIMERDGKGVPELFGIYGRFNTKYLATDFDKSFNTYDILAWTDLRQSSLGSLTPYFGEAGASNFLRHWGVEAP